MGSPPWGQHHVGRGRRSLAAAPALALRGSSRNHAEGWIGWLSSWVSSSCLWGVNTATALVSFAQVGDAPGVIARRAPPTEALRGSLKPCSLPPVVPPCYPPPPVMSLRCPPSGSWGNSRGPGAGVHGHLQGHHGAVRELRARHRWQKVTGSQDRMRMTVANPGGAWLM